MKKFILYTTGFILFLFIAVITTPFLFKEQLKAKLLKEVDKKINAEISFSDVSVTAFKNFPHIGINFHDFFIIGKSPFQGDTLATAKVMTISFDFYTVLKGNNIDIKSIHLDDPVIHIRVLKDGEANYSIALSDSTKKDTSSFDLAVERWEINNGKIIYDDGLQRTYIEMDGVNHSGNGDFKQDISDLKIATKVDELTYYFNGVKYLDKKKFGADLMMEMNFNESKFTFKDHEFQINHFKFAFDGYFKFLKQGYDVDMKFVVKETNFKNLLSILPGFYLHDFEKLKTKGEFILDGHLKGVYNYVNNQIPEFHVNFKVIDGYFKYDHLPKAVENINFDMLIENKDGKPENTSISINKFHLDMDKNPVHGYFKMKGLTNRFIDTDIKTRINLAELEKMYPVKGLVVKGILFADIKANGIYNDSLKIFPIVDTKIRLDSGYLKDVDFPIPIESIHLNAEIFNSTGQLADTRINLNKITYTVDGEPFIVSGKISDLTDYNYNLKIDGLMDLGKLTSIYPIKDATVSGTIDVDIETAGKMSDLQAKRFKLLKTSGSMEVKNMEYNAKGMFAKLKLTDAKIGFTPDKIIFNSFIGEIARTNFTINGHLFDYFSSVFDTGRPIKGDLQMTADTLNLNEMLSDDDKPKDTTQSNLQPVIIPTNIDFTFDSEIGFVKFHQMDITNLKGEIRVRNGVFTLNETGFNAADAKFGINADYDTRDPKHPMFDLVLDIDKLDLNKGYAMFGILQAAAPAAKTTDGVFTTKYSLKGEIGPDFKPIYETLTGNGTIIIEEAQIKGMTALGHVSKITKKEELNNPKVKDIVMETEIKGGRIYIKPFSFKLGKFTTDFAGNHGFNNTLNYVLRLGIPPFNKLKIPFNITGTMDKPIIKLGKGHENYDFSKL
jgi:hypothetical protein